MIAVYFVIVTMCTVGYGDIRPVSVYETILSLFSIILACGVFAFAINKIGIVLSVN